MEIDEIFDFAIKAMKAGISQSAIREEIEAAIRYFNALPPEQRERERVYSAHNAQRLTQ